MKKIAFMFVAAIVMASCGAKEEKKAAEAENENQPAVVEDENAEAEAECCEGAEGCEATECCEGAEEATEEAPVVEETAE